MFLIDLNSGIITRTLGNLPQPLESLAIPTAPVAYAIVISNNNLMIINSINGALSFNTKSITGLQTGESIVGLDIRPANGQLVGLGSTSRLYSFNGATA